MSLVIVQMSHSESFKSDLNQLARCWCMWPFRFGPNMAPVIAQLHAKLFRPNFRFSYVLFSSQAWILRCRWCLFARYKVVTWLRKKTVAQLKGTRFVRMSIVTTFFLLYETVFNLLCFSPARPKLLNGLAVDSLCLLLTFDGQQSIVIKTIHSMRSVWQCYVVTQS